MDLKIEHRTMDLAFGFSDVSYISVYLISISIFYIYYYYIIIGETEGKSN